MQNNSTYSNWKSHKGQGYQINFTYSLILCPEKRIRIWGNKILLGFAGLGHLYKMTDCHKPNRLKLGFWQKVKIKSKARLLFSLHNNKLQTWVSSVCFQGICYSAELLICSTILIDIPITTNLLLFFLINPKMLPKKCLKPMRLECV